MCDCMALSTPAGECPRKARKHNFALNCGFCGLFQRRKAKTYNFIHASGIPHIFPFVLKERRMKQLASLHWRWSIIHNIDLSRCLCFLCKASFAKFYTTVWFGMYWICFQRRKTHRRWRKRDSMTIPGVNPQQKHRCVTLRQAAGSMHARPGEKEDHSN